MGYRHNKDERKLKKLAVRVAGVLARHEPGSKRAELTAYFENECRQEEEMYDACVADASDQRP